MFLRLRSDSGDAGIAGALSRLHSRVPRERLGGSTVIRNMAQAVHFLAFSRFHGSFYVNRTNLVQHLAPLSAG